MWEQVRLEKLFDVGSAKRVLKSQWQTEGVPFYRGREITKLSQQGFVNNDLYITEELYQEYKDKYGVPSEGDIVITAIGTIGNSYIVQKKDRFYYKDASVLCLKKTSDVDSHFINYWLKSFNMKSQLDEGNGATVDTLTISKMKSLVIDLPPLEEQKRIVAILGEAFAGIDEAIAHTEQNIQNARDLFESHLNTIFTQKGEGWEEIMLRDVCDLISGQHIEVKNYNTDQRGIGYLTGPSDFGAIHPTVSKWTEYPKKTAINGDILITVKGSGVGKVNLMDAEELVISRQLMAVRATGISTALIYAFLKSQFSYFQSLATGAAIPGISRTDVLGLKIFLPSPSEQKEIVFKLDALRAETQNLETTYQQKLTALKDLKQSLLQQAFAGELTADLSEAA